MSTVSLFGNTWQEGSLPSLSVLVKQLCATHLDVEVEREFYDWLSAHGVEMCRCRATENPSEQSRMIISAGGDGTLLKAARWGAMCRIPVAGVNTGHLGFLTAWHADDVSALVQALIDDDFEIEERSMLRVECDALGDDVWPYALNDVALLKENSGSMINVRTQVDGSYLTDYAADGLVIATPSGSTAYNLSAGGPILQPTVPAIVLTPVAPHTLTMRPLVISDTCRVSTVTDSRTDSFMLSIDGAVESLPAGTRVDVVKASLKLQLVKKSRGSFAGALRDKLLWGFSSRSNF